MIGWRVGQTIVALAFVIVSFSLIYYYGPDLEEQHWYWITSGRADWRFVVGWQPHLHSAAYLHFFNSYSKTYGFAPP